MFKNEGKSLNQKAFEKGTDGVVTDKSDLLCCDEYGKGVKQLNGLISFAANRGNINPYDRKPFKYCPWCGSTVKPTT